MALSARGEPSFCSRSGIATATADGYGECRITSLHDAFGTWIRVHIDRADARVLINGELVARWRAAGGEPFYGNPFMTVRPGPDAAQGLGAPAKSLKGRLVTIRGENRTVVYRIGEYLADRDCFEAEWPD